MGLEAKCQARFGTQSAVLGKLHLDSVALTFSGGGIKWRLSLQAKRKAIVAEGWLFVASGRQSAAFELGNQARKWLEKIQHPPTRLDKLGIKPGHTCLLQGKFPPEFLAELKQAKVATSRSAGNSQVALLLVESPRELKRWDQLLLKAQPKTHFWLVWPKGTEAITQEDVLNYAADLGLGPNKSCAFDARLTAMRFMKR